MNKKQILLTLMCAVALTASSFAGRQVSNLAATPAPELTRRKEKDISFGGKIVNFFWKRFFKQKLFQKPQLGKLILENQTSGNKGEELLRQVVSFVDLQTLSNLRESCKYIKNIVDQECPDLDKQESPDEALNYYAKSGNLDVIKRVIQHPKITPEGVVDEALLNAVLNGHIGIVKFLVTKDKITSCGVNLALILASRDGHLEIVQYLITNEITKDKITSNGIDYALKETAANGHLKIVKELTTNEITKKLIISKGIDEALYYAASNGHKEIAELLEKFKEENFSS